MNQANNYPEGFFERVSESRRKPKVGDVFAFRPKTTKLWMFIRVIELKCEEAGFPGTLIYIYKYAVPDLIVPDRLPVSDLLMGPRVVGNEPWAERVFLWVCNRPIEPDEKLPHHYFGHPDRFPKGTPMTWIVAGGLTLLMGIEADVAEALNLPEQEWHELVYGQYSRYRKQ